MSELRPLPGPDLSPDSAPDPAAVPVSPRPSSAVVLARELPDGGFEVFMVRRHINSEFVPDAFVFPGGSVKPQDLEAEQVPGLCAPVAGGPTALGSGFRVAALRECFEEAGVLLARHGDRPLAITAADTPRFAAYRDALFADRTTLAEIAAREALTLATDDLLWWAHWITPEAMPKRFTTHFFLAPMPPEQEAAHDQLETTEGAWRTPAEALAGFERGDFPLVFATIHQLRELAGIESLAAARAHYAQTTPRTIRPRVVQREGRAVILHPDEDAQSGATMTTPSTPSTPPLPPGVACILAPNPSLMTGPGTNTYLITSRAGVCAVVDPGPLIEEHLARVAAAASAAGRLRAILITHGHPDHIEGAARLRELTGAPIFAWSREGTPDADTLLADSATVPLGERTIRVLHTPGHRFDHVCFLLDDAAALFAGDLVAGVGTVVIAPPEGDLADYMASLRRLLTLDLRQILPAHGPSVDNPRALLEQYIAHRNEREAQVLAGLAAGPATVATLVAAIYADVDPKLHPAAAYSVTAHLLKLEREHRVTRTPGPTGATRPAGLAGPASPSGDELWQLTGEPPTTP